MAKVERESINFKLPKTLTKVLREKARDLNTTATDLVIQGLEHVLDLAPSTDNGIDNRLQMMEAELKRLANSRENRADNGTESLSPQRFTQLEQQMQELTKRLSVIESALIQMQSNTGSYKGRRSSGYSHYQQHTIELQPMLEENLAKRLAVTVSTLSNQRATLSQKDFLSWSRSRDTNSVGWRYEEKDKLYHPMK
jgi:exonuclease VII large subunit